MEEKMKNSWLLELENSFNIFLKEPELINDFFKNLSEEDKNLLLIETLSF